MSEYDPIHAQTLEAALLDVPAEVYDRIKETVDGNGDIACGSYFAMNEGGELCGCLLFDGYTAARGQEKSEDAKRIIEDESDSDQAAADLLSEFYGVNVPRDSLDWAMKLIQAYDQWSDQYDGHGDEIYSVDYLINDVGRTELRQIFKTASLVRAVA